MSKAFYTIKEACKETGLSQHYLRISCKNGTIPHMVIGTKYMINLPMLMKVLDAQSMEGGQGDG